MIGVVFFLLAKMLESGGAVFELPPIVIAWLPTVLLALITPPSYRVAADGAARTDYEHRRQSGSMTAGVLRRFGAMLYDAADRRRAAVRRDCAVPAVHRRRGDHARRVRRARAHLSGGVAARDRAVLLCVLDAARSDARHARVAPASGAQRRERCSRGATRCSAWPARACRSRRSASATSGSGSIATGSRGTTAGAARASWWCRRRSRAERPTYLADQLVDGFEEALVLVVGDLVDPRRLKRSDG